MRKIKLAVESLDVHSFPTSQAMAVATGTVQGRHWSMTDCPDSYSYMEMCICMPMDDPSRNDC